jgi:hypothetical protein
MALAKRLGFSFVTGAIVGAVAAGAIAPPFLTWYNAPSAGQALCNCTELVHNTATVLLHALIISAIVGGVLLDVAVILVTLARRSRGRNDAKAEPIR